MNRQRECVCIVGVTEGLAISLLRIIGGGIMSHLVMALFNGGEIQFRVSEGEFPDFLCIDKVRGNPEPCTPAFHSFCL